MLVYLYKELTLSQQKHLDELVLQPQNVFGWSLQTQIVNSWMEYP